MKITIVLTRYITVLGLALILAPLILTACPTNSIPVTSVSISPADPLTLGVGERETLSAEVSPDNATSRTVTWTSSAPAVARVESATGVVTAVAYGTTNITATADGVTSPPLVVTVSPIAVTGVSISPSVPFSLAVGNDKPLSAAVRPGNATNRTITWASSAPTVASVDSTSGLVTAVASGTANITATAGGVTSPPLAVTVYLVPVTGVSISPSVQFSLVVGDDKFLSAAVSPDNATNRTVTWTSSAPAVASVDSTSGLVTAVTPGTANITATAGGVINHVLVSVSPADIHVTDVSIYLADPLALEVGETAPLSAVVSPSNATNQTVTWASSAPTVASVNLATGLVTAVAPGTADITATADGVTSLALAVNVLPVNIPVTDVSIYLADPLALVVGATATLSAAVSPDNATYKTVTWASSAPTVASVNSSTGLVTAVAPGTANITATADGVTSHAVAVTVSAPLGEGTITISWSDFYDRAPPEIVIQDIRILAHEDKQIVVDGSFDSVTWFFVCPISRVMTSESGPTLALALVHNNTIGKFRFTVEVEMGGRRYSRIITFRVVS